MQGERRWQYFPQIPRVWIPTRTSSSVQVGRPVRGRHQQGERRSSAPPRWSSIARAAIPSTSRKSPGRNEYEAITLERGVTQDMAFEHWAGKVWNLGAGLGSEVRWQDFRKDIYLELYNEAGQKVIAYKIYRCWVSEYQAMPELDANANAIAIEHIKLENEGWERDTSVTEPPEPTLSIVAT